MQLIAVHVYICMVNILQRACMHLQLRAYICMRMHPDPVRSPQIKVVGIRTV
jgi:hypothetical protein